MYRPFLRSLPVSIIALWCLFLLGLSKSSGHTDPPVANDDTYLIREPGTIGPVQANDTPPPGGFIDAIEIVDLPRNGILSAVSLGNFSYTPTVPKAGSDSFTYRACTMNICSAPATVSLKYDNSAPIAIDDSYVVHYPNGYAGPFTANDFDPDGDSFNIADIIPSSTGNIVYTGTATPGLGFVQVNSSAFFGLEQMSYWLVDSFGLHSSFATVNIFIVNNGNDENLGAMGCNARVGQPVNVTNGNMYVQQTDYRLPGVGPSIDITRTYNSLSQSAGLFGAKWSTLYDERITAYDNKLLRLELSDGRAVYFGRSGTSGPFNPLTPQFFGSITKNANGTYTFSTTDGQAHQFSSTGKLTSLADRNNNQTSLSYDGNGHLASITDTFGRTVTVATDSMGRITALSDGAGVIANYAYDGTDADVLALRSANFPDGSKYVFSHVIVGGNQYLTTITDARGKVVEHHDYDSTGRAYTSERQNGVDKYTLNFVGATETHVTDAEGHLTKYTFRQSNGRNLVTKVEGLCNCGGSQIERWAYDERGNVVSATNALNQVTTYTYDASGNPLTTTDLNGNRAYTYNSFSQVLTATDPMAGVTTMTYDTHGNLLTIKDALNNTTTFTVNARGQVTSVKDARTDSNNTTTFDYQGGPNLMGKTDPLGHTTSFTYWPRGWLKSVSDTVTQSGSPVTLTTQYEYDAVGRSKKMIYPDPAHSFVENTYDEAGRLTSVKDAGGKITNYAYDEIESAYRVKTITDPLGHTTTFGYTPMSRLAFRKDALNQQTDYEYDDFGRLKKVIYPPAVAAGPRLAEEFTEYDALGRIVKYHDTAGRLTSYTYDDVNRINTVVDPLSQTTKFQYNQRQQLIKVTDALLQEYQFTPDALGRVTSLTRGGQTMSYTYDPVGNRTQRIDYNGTTTNYGYDKLNRLHSVMYSGGMSATYDYDEISRLVSAANQNGTVSFVYDNRSRVVSTTDVLGKTIAYTYDANGNRTSMTLGSSVGITYDLYDDANRLRQMTDNASGVYTFNYDDANRPTSRTLPNGVATTASYDGISRLTQLKHSLGSGTINDFQYTYNSASAITQITEPARTRSFGYDGVDRLTAVTNSAGSNESYTYDSVGNRTSSHLSASYGLQPFNKIVSTATASYTYDGNGNMTSRWDAAGRWYFNWDAENRLVRVVKPGWRPLSYRTITYAYDALGRRTERQSKTAGTENYTYDGQDVILDQNSSGAQTTYINGPGIDNKLKMVSGSTASYFLQDHLGSTTALTNSSGAVVSSATYDGYGRQSGAIGTHYGYTGRELDPDTGLMFYRARWYDTQLGRFIGEDPIGFLGGDINVYSYVRNNPLQFNDPLGLCNPIVGALVGGAIGLNVGAALGALAGFGLGTLVGAGAVGGGLVFAGPPGALAGAVFAVPAIGIFTLGGIIGGGIIGAGIGGYAGYQYCSGGGSTTCNSAPSAPPIPLGTPDTNPIPFPSPSNPPLLPPPLPFPRVSPEKREECFKKCEHLLYKPHGRDQGTLYRKCYRECIGTL